MTIYPLNLKCEYQKEPVVDSADLRFSWQLGIGENEAKKTNNPDGRIQGNYQLQIMEEDTEEIIYDSGKVDSDTVWCEVYGLKLKDDTYYIWKVTVWDVTDEERSEAVSRFSTGLLRKESWKAKWIEPEQKPVQDGQNLSMEEMFEQSANGGVAFDYTTIYPCKFMRREFTVSKKVKRARVFATAHGLYRLEINGNCVNPDELAPGNAPYEKILPYQTYDVTELLTNGKNTVGIVLADGWYAGRIGCTGDSCQYGNRLAALMQINFIYADGTKDYVISDEKFRSSEGPLQYSDIFLGEKYDAGKEIEGWSRTGYLAEEWKPVKIVEEAMDQLTAQYGEKVICIEELPAVQVIQTPEGDMVVDFGQVIAGRVRMKVSGEQGQEIILEHTETLDENGNFFKNITGIYKDQTDYYILKGGTEEEYEPWFTYHGFRYVRVTGYPGEVRKENFTARVLSTGMEQTGNFRCSNEDLNRLQENIRWSLRGNTLSIPTDCPQRERAGWTGDVQVIAPTACYNLDAAAFFSRYLAMIRAEQRDDGAVPIVVPFIKAYQKAATTGLGEQILPDNITSAGWGDVCTFLPWDLYEIYQDKRILKENYPMMKKWLKYITGIAENYYPQDLKELTEEERERQKYLWNTNFHFGDWVTPSVCIDPETGKTDMERSALLTNKYIPTIFYAASAEITAKTAELLGKKEESEFYYELNRRIRIAFAEEYIDEQGYMPQPLQGMYVLGLKFKMFPEEKIPMAVEHLTELIRKNDYRLDTGFMSVPYLLDELCEYGYEELALKILYQEQCPSWLYEVKHGATTIWETWEAIHPDGRVEKDSLNHYAFGCIGHWLYENLAGIQAAAPGYRKSRIRPLKASGLDWVEASYQTIYGRIAARTDFKNGKMDIQIPFNTTATVSVPGKLQKIDCELPYEQKERDGYTMLDLPGGTYQIYFQMPEV